MATKKYLRIKDLLDDPFSEHNWRLNDYDREWAIGRAEALHEVREILDAEIQQALHAGIYEAVILLRALRGRMKGLQRETHQVIGEPPQHL